MLLVLFVCARSLPPHLDARSVSLWRAAEVDCRSVAQADREPDGLQVLDWQVEDDRLDVHAQGRLGDEFGAHDRNIRDVNDGFRDLQCDALGRGQRGEEIKGTADAMAIAAIVYCVCFW